ncbi:1-aminocyclopropane-1-carboxylate deaminase/D-cysteine desulfhydrase [Thalassotalea fusca]
MPNVSPVQKLNHPLFTEYGIEVFVKRDDLIHPIISGNKWRKLKYNLESARKQNINKLLSFGGAYSNHIHALAYAAYTQGFSSHAIIRGESSYQDNYTLTWARNWGMTLTFVDRATYRRRNEPEYLAALSKQYPDHQIIPEGGSNQAALMGVGEVLDELVQQLDGYDTLICPVGSGGTIAGLVKADNNKHQILGIPVLKHNGYLVHEIELLLGEQYQHCDQWQLLDDFHCGGYGKFSADDLLQMQAFYQQCKLPIEPMYSGKMVLALLSLIRSGHFTRGHRIVLLHTGGIQGLGGFIERGIIQASEWPSLPAPPAQ